MADDGSKQSASGWPLPKFYFAVEWEVDAGEVLLAAFQEVAGLEVEAQVIEDRSNDKEVFSTMKMPDMVKSSNITLKKGVIANDSRFYDWYAKIKMNTIVRTTVTISLRDESGTPSMVWSLSNAWPTKITATDLHSDGDEVAVESIELAHEGLVIVNA